MKYHLLRLNVIQAFIFAMLSGCASNDSPGESQSVMDAATASDGGQDAQYVPDGYLTDASDPSIVDSGTTPTPTTAQVFSALEPQCTACHGANTQDPYFESLDSFERLIVSNPDYIVPGNAFESELSALLAATGSGAFRQMPPFGDSYESLVQTGQASMPVSEIDRWINALPPIQIDPLNCDVPQPGRAPLRRLTSTEYKFAVQDLLGIDLDPTTTFPPQEEALGFNNNADALNVTRLLAEKYFEAGEMSAEAALADPIALLEHVGLPCRMARLECVRDLAQALAYQAYRRPLEPNELDRIMALFQRGEAELGDFLEGIKLVIAGILQSPHFLYRLEFGESPPEGALAVRLTDFEIASRLSFFLWSSMPDRTLFEAAERGELQSPAQIELQARRMIEDPKARRAVAHFYTQWLGLSSLPELAKNTALFPEWSPRIGHAMVQEVTALAQHLTWDAEAGIHSLFNTPVSFLNGPLASFYGVPGINGDEFQQIEFDPQQRNGIMTRGGVMAVHAKANQGSPILRGVFVRERILCQQLPNPPDNVDNSPPELDPGSTTRARFAAHTEVESCAACHRLIDPIGFAFENFDAVGLYRTMENGQPIDTSAEVVDGDELNGTYADAQAMTEAFADSGKIRRCVIRQWFRYGNGRVENGDDACSMDQMWTHLAARNFSLKEILVAMTQTDAFRFRPVDGGQP